MKILMDWTMFPMPESYTTYASIVDFEIIRTAILYPVSRAYLQTMLKL